MTRKWKTRENMSAWSGKLGGAGKKKAPPIPSFLPNIIIIIITIIIIIIILFLFFISMLALSHFRGTDYLGTRKRLSFSFFVAPGWW